jgi:formate dehydrogenase accessory protein FdhD
VKEEFLEEKLDQTGAVERPVAAWSGRNDKGLSSPNDWIAQEVPVAIVYNGISYAVMMASPLDLEAFALGFSLTEGIVGAVHDIYSTDVVVQEKGIEVALSISNKCFMNLKNRRRNLSGRSGCGICGVESLEQVQQQIKPVEATFSVSHAAIELATQGILNHQPLQELTGAVHGAAWCDQEGNIVLVCEDVGRHNALDKLVGVLWPQDKFELPGFLLMSSRASFEILNKAAKAGIAVVVAMSAPTSLAIEIANKTGITLVGFSRQGRHVIYANNERIIEKPA